MMASRIRWLARSRNHRTAAVVVALFGAVGVIVVGIDLISAQVAHRRMKEALDAATVAVMSRPLDGTLTQRQTLLASFYFANGGKGVARIVVDVEPGSLRPVVEAIATADRPARLINLPGMARGRLRVRSAAARPAELQQVTFRLGEIWGLFDKKVSLLGRRAGATGHIELMSIDYAWSDAAGTARTTTVSRLLEGVMIPTLRVRCTSTARGLSCVDEVLSGDGSATVNLMGYDDIYLQMQISARTAEGLAMLNGPYSHLPRVIATNSGSHADRLFIDGVQQAGTAKVDLFNRIPCGQTSRQAWEDGGSFDAHGAQPETLSAHEADFHYTVQGACGFRDGTSAVNIVH